MADIGTLIDFTGGNVLYAAQLDSNFGAIRTVVNNAVLHTDKAGQTLTKTLSFTPDSGVAITINSGGQTITAGNLTLTAGNLVVTAGNITVSAGTTAVQALTCTTLAPSGTSTLQAVTCTTLNASGAITGTLATAAQTNVTSLGTLTALTISGVLTLSNASPLSLAATSKFVVGATSFTIRDSGDSVTTFGVAGTGTSTVVSVACGSSGSSTISGNSGNSLVLSSSNARINASGGLILLGTDGTSTIADTATVGMPCMPVMAGSPSALLPAGRNGMFVGDSSNNRLYLVLNNVWKYVNLT
jgi:hypothetical protein